MDPKGHRSRGRNEGEEGTVTSLAAVRRHRTHQTMDQLAEALQKTRWWVDEIIEAHLERSRKKRETLQRSCQPQSMQVDPGPSPVSQERAQAIDAGPVRLPEKDTGTPAQPKDSGDAAVETAKDPTITAPSQSEPLQKVDGSGDAGENMVAIHSCAIRRDFQKIRPPSGALAEKMLRIYQFEVRIPNAAQHGKKKIMAKINGNLLERIPHQWLRSDGDDIVFNVPYMAHSIVCEKLSERMILPNGKKMLIHTKPTIPALKIDDDKLKSLIITRYDREKKSLNLASLYVDDEISSLGWDLRLNKSETVDKVVGMICSKRFKKMVALDLSCNEIQTLKPFAPLVSKTPHVAHLNLAFNKLDDFEDLDEIQGWKLKELVLKGNPLVQPTSDMAMYSRTIGRNFQDLMFLDEMTLVRVQDDRSVPASQGSFFLNYQVRDHVVSFLDAFFKVLDSDDKRYRIQDAYSRRGTFRLVTIPNPGMDTYSQRSLEAYSKNDKAEKTVRHFDGSIAICDLYKSFPPTQHIPSSLMVDVGMACRNQLFITVNGLFTEDQKNAKLPVRCFTKAFHCRPRRGWFNLLITTETLTITNALPEQETRAYQALGFDSLPSSGSTPPRKPRTGNPDILPLSTRDDRGSPAHPSTSSLATVPAAPTEVLPAPVDNAASTTFRISVDPAPEVTPQPAESASLTSLSFSDDANNAAFMLYHLFQGDVLEEPRSPRPPGSQSPAFSKRSTVSVSAPLPTTTCGSVSAPPDASTSHSNVSAPPDVPTSLQNVSAQPDVSTTLRNVSAQPDVSTSLSNVSAPPDVSTSLSNVSAPPDVSTSLSNVSAPPDVSTSLSNVSAQPDASTSLSNVLAPLDATTSLSNVSAPPDVSTSLSNVSAQPDASTSLSNVLAPLDATTSLSSPALPDAGIPLARSRKTKFALSDALSPLDYLDTNYSPPSSPSVCSSPTPKRRRKSSTASTSCLQAYITPVCNLNTPRIPKRSLFTPAPTKSRQQSATRSKSQQPSTAALSPQWATPKQSLQSAAHEQHLQSSPKSIQPSTSKQRQESSILPRSLEFPTISSETLAQTQECAATLAEIEQSPAPPQNRHSSTILPKNTDQGNLPACSSSGSWLDEHSAPTSGGVFVRPIAAPRRSKKPRAPTSVQQSAVLPTERQKSPSPTQSWCSSDTPTEDDDSSICSFNSPSWIDRHVVHHIGSDFAQPISSPAQSFQTVTHQLSSSSPPTGHGSSALTQSLRSSDSPTQSNESAASSLSWQEENSAQTFGSMDENPRPFSPWTLRKLSPTYTRPASAPSFLYSWMPSEHDRFDDTGGNLVSPELLSACAAEVFLAQAASRCLDLDHVSQGSNRSSSDLVSPFRQGSGLSFPASIFGTSHLREMKYKSPSDSESLPRRRKKSIYVYARCGLKSASQPPPSIYHSDMAPPSQDNPALDLCYDAYSPWWRPEELPKLSGNTVKVGSTLGISQDQTTAASPSSAIPSSAAHLLPTCSGSHSTRGRAALPKLSKSDSNLCQPLSARRKERPSHPSFADVMEACIHSTTESSSVQPGSSSGATSRASTARATSPKPSTSSGVATRTSSRRRLAPATSISVAVAPRASTSGASRSRASRGAIDPPSPGFRSQLRRGNVTHVSDEPLTRPSDDLDYHSLSKTKQILVCHVAAISGLKKEWAAQCLIQSGWDFGAATLYLEKRNTEGGFPADAFLFAP